MRVKKQLGVAMAAMSIAAVAGGIGAAGAQARSEVIQGTATTTSGTASGSCGSQFSKSVGAQFNAAGSATGPYPGQFTNTNANGIVSGEQRPGYERLALDIPFAISSGTTTITGRITNPYPWGGGLFLCNGSALVAFEAATSWAYYTATIQRSGHPAETISGNAQVYGNFYTQPGAQTAVTETLAFP